MLDNTIVLFTLANRCIYSANYHWFNPKVWHHDLLTHLAEIAKSPDVISRSCLFTVQLMLSNQIKASICRVLELLLSSRIGCYLSDRAIVIFLRHTWVISNNPSLPNDFHSHSIWLTWNRHVLVLFPSCPTQIKQRVTFFRFLSLK